MVNQNFKTRSVQSDLSAQDLHERAKLLASSYRKCEAELLDILQKIDASRAYLELGYASLFMYGVNALDLSEAQAYAFIKIARKSIEIPRLKEEISSGALTISKATRIVAVVNKENQSVWIAKAKELPKQELEREVSKVAPEAFRRPEFVRVLAENRVGLRLELNARTYDKLRRAQTLLMTRKRRTLNLSDCLDVLLDDFLKRADPLRKEERKRPDEVGKVVRVNHRAISSRWIKRSLSVPQRREVLKSTGGKCSFVGSGGIICGAESFLNVHHLRPWAQGGGHESSNLQVLCESHHRFVHERMAVMRGPP